jgi:hypothetical protein
MNVKRWLFASLAVLVVIAAVEMVINSVLLAGLYQQTASVWRPPEEIQRTMWLFWLGYLVFAPFFTLIYAKGHEPAKSGLGQGLRYGLYMGLVLSVMQNLVWYAVLPIPGVLAFYWFLGGMVESIAAGVAVGLIYRA